MTKEEVIARIKNHMIIHKMNEPRAIYISEALDMAIKAIEQEHCKDAISRHAVLDVVKKNTFRLTFAEEQGCEGHVAWSAKAVYSDVIEGALLELPPVTPQPKMGHWIDDEFGSKCSCCGIYTHLDKFERPMKFKCCSMCGAKMVESQESEDYER